MKSKLRYCTQKNEVMCLEIVSWIEVLLTTDMGVE